MKRFLSLCIGLSMLGSATSAHALNMNPISQHYVDPVLQRVDAGLAILPGGTATNFQFMFFTWLMEISSIFLELVDTELRVDAQQRDLYKITPCLHIDLIILEEKIEQIREETKRAFKDKRVIDIMRLQSMARFLNDRYRHLVRGARDPHYQDPGFNAYYLFDAVAWCCPDTNPSICSEQDRNTCRQNGGLTFRTVEDCAAFPECEKPAFLPPQSRVCPFHSDYLPPTSVGYGCDVRALDAIGSGGHAPSQEERDALDDFMQKRNAFLNDMSFIGTMTVQIYNAIGRPVPPDFLDNFLAGLNQPHRTREGCSLFDAPLYLPPATDFDPPPQWPEGAAKWELRGPFFITRDEVRLVRGMHDQLRKWGDDREQADYLKFPSEFVPGSAQRANAETREQKMGVIQKIIRNFVRAYFNVWNIEQQTLDTRAVIQSGDSQKQLAELTDRLHGTMIEFYELASKKSRGIRSFTTKFTFFIRRTCIYRPCNKMLDRVLKINLEDACFPYVSGAYDGDLTHHETCKNAASVGESF
jgi:hypothetical protein